MTEHAKYTEAAFRGTLAFGGSDWIWKKRKLTFKALENRDAGSFDPISGDIGAKREIVIQALKSDFGGSLPEKRDVLFRADNLKVEYWVKEDAGTETGNDATFNLTLELKHG